MSGLQHLQQLLSKHSQYMFTVFLMQPKDHKAPEQVTSGTKF